MMAATKDRFLTMMLVIPTIHERYTLIYLCCLKLLRLKTPKTCVICVARKTQYKSPKIGVGLGTATKRRT